MPSSATPLDSNDVCDSLWLHSGPLSAICCATPPSRNGLSHAGKHRNAEMAEQLFWSMLGHLQTLSPGFAGSKRSKGPLHRFRATIIIVDSTTIEPVASCMDWVKHRRRKAAAKCHMRLDLQSFLPVLVDSAKQIGNRGADCEAHPDGAHTKTRGSLRGGVWPCWRRKLDCRGFPKRIGKCAGKA
jgi:hypothetical protein